MKANAFRLHKLIPILVFIFGMLAGSGDMIIWSYASIIVVICGMFFDKCQAPIYYLALFIPWFPAYGITSGFLAFCAYIVADFIRGGWRYAKRELIWIFLIVIVIVTSCFGDEVLLRNVVLLTIPMMLLFMFSFHDIRGLVILATSRIYALSTIITGILGGIGGVFSNLITKADFMIYGNVNTYFSYIFNGNIVRFSGILMDANFWGLNCLFAAAFLLLPYMKKITKGNKDQNKRNSLDFVMIVILLIMGALSLSATYLVTLICVAMYVILVLPLSNRKKIILYLAIALVGSLTVFYLVANPPMIIAAYSDRLNNTSLTSRVDIWQEYFSEINEGLKTMLVGYGSYVMSTVTAHNIFIRLIYMHGYIGTAILIISIIRLYLYKKRNNRESILLIMVLLMFYMTLDPFRDDSTYTLGFYLIVIWQVMSKRVKKNSVIGDV